MQPPTEEKLPPKTAALMKLLLDAIECLVSRETFTVSRLVREARALLKELTP